MRALLEQHVQGVWRFALRLTQDRHLAEDLTQETFLRAWRGRKRLRDPSAARVWLFKIAANAWRDQLRRGNRVPKRREMPCERQEGSASPPERVLIDREDVERALEAMDSLPPRQREVLYLHACEELSIVEIAQVLDISTQAVKSSLSLARKSMRARFHELCEDRFPTG